MTKALEALDRLKKTATEKKRSPGGPPGSRKGTAATAETLNAGGPPRASYGLSKDTLQSTVPEALSTLDEDQRELFEERAAIMEIDGGLPRHKARARAWKLLFGQVAVDNLDAIG